MIRLVGAASLMLLMGFTPLGAQDLSIRNIIIQSDTIWVASSSGLLAWNVPNDVVVRYGKEDGMPSNEVAAVYQDSSQNIWVNTEGGLARFSQGTWLSWTNVPNFRNKAKSFFIDRSGTVWASFPDAIARFLNGRWEVENLGENLVGAGKFFQALNGDLWFLSVYPSDYIFRYSAGQWNAWTTRQITETPELQDFLVVITEDLESNIWVADRYGRIAQFDGEIWKYWSEEDGIGYRTSILEAEEQVRKLFVDNRGYLWGWGVNGVNMYDGNTWHSYSQMFYMLGDVAVDKQSNIWITSFLTSVGVAQFEGTSWRVHEAVQGVSQPSRLYVDSLDRIWGSGYSTVWLYESGTWRQWRAASLDSNFFNYMAEGAEGEMWFWEQDRVGRFKDNAWDFWLLEDIGLADNIAGVTIHPSVGIVVTANKNEVVFFNGDKWLQMPIPSAFMPGDFNWDSAVNFYDFFLFADAFDIKEDDARWNPIFDLDGNNAVDLDDFFIFADSFAEETRAKPAKSR